MLPSAFSFDHYTHIRADLFRPRGPLTGPPPLRRRAAASARAGLGGGGAAAAPQNPAAVKAGASSFQITGPAARIITFGTGQAMATVSSDADAFIRWVTQRASWEDLGVQATAMSPRCRRRGS